MDMFTSYDDIKKPKENHQFFYDFRPGCVPITYALIQIVQYVSDFWSLGSHGSQ